MLASSEWETGDIGRMSSLERNDVFTRGEGTSLEERRSEDENLSISEVYEVAASIGKEFEAIIDRYGPDTVCGLMPKVIDALEELEEQITSRDNQYEELTALRTAVERLQVDKLSREEQRLRIEQELVKVEEIWSTEASELNGIIKKLTEENSRLSESFDLNNKLNESRSSSSATSATRSDQTKLLQQLKEAIHNQKVDLRFHRQLLSQRIVDLDAMKLQAERLAHQNAKEIHLCHDRLKIASVEIEMAGGTAFFLAQEVVKLEAQLKAKKIFVEAIRHHLSPNGTQNSNDDSHINFSMTASAYRELGAASPTAKKIVTLMSDVKNDSASGVISTTMDARNARFFTYDDLHQILTECMHLESEIIQIKDQLDVYRRAGDDAPPVQGPINRESKGNYHRPSYPLTIGVKQIFQTLIGKMRK